MVVINALVLKLIALATMILDHYGAIFQPDQIIFRMIGRLAFPIYCFLLVEGFVHSNNLKKYARRLFIFAFISELPFDYAFYGGINWSHQNIFFTLFIGLIAICLVENRYIKKSIAAPLVGLGAAFLATVMSVDYSFIGIIYILGFYYTKDLGSLRRISTVAILMFFTNLALTGHIQQYSLLALPIILLYNGAPSPRHPVIKHSFYWAYPLHLLVFAILKGRFPFL